MRRASLLAVSVGLLLPAGTLATPRKHHRYVFHCRPGHPHLLAAGTRAEVFDAGIAEPDEFRAEEILGCVYGRTHAYFIGGAPDYSGTEGAGSNVKALAGVMVAAEGNSYSIFYGSFSSVYVKDLLTGRTVYSAGLPGAATSVVLKQNGSIAWIASGGLSSAPVPHEEWVYAMDGGGQRVLAHGHALKETTEIGALALSRDEHTVYWTQAGQPHAAPLN